MNLQNFQENAVVFKRRYGAFSSCNCFDDYDQSRCKRKTARGLPPRAARGTPIRVDQADFFMISSATLRGTGS